MQVPIKRSDKRMAQPDKHHPMRSGRALSHHMAMRAAPGGAPAEQDPGPSHVPEKHCCRY
jgi:hypothetical protein